jgi:hypothetical protein
MAKEERDENREDLDLDGSGGSIPPKPNMPESEKSHHEMETHVPDNHEILTPGMSNEQVLDQILSVPQEKLIPWEECELPSQGLYYGWPDGVISVRAMGQKAEKILATQRLASSGQSIDYLFRECAKFPDAFDPSDLVLGDRVFLLYFLRGITHGNLYEFAVACPNQECQQVHTHTYDLNQLAATIRPAKRELGEEPFKVVLPYLSKSVGRDIWVELRLLRAYDANDMIARRKVRKKMVARPGRARNANQPVDPRQQQQQQVVLDTALDDNLEKVIATILGDGDKMKIRQFVQQLHAQDTATIREWLRENTPGIDNTIKIDCPDCGGDFTVELPITESFFRPVKA